MKLYSFGITDVGLKRTHNEDNFFRSDELGLYLIADGMGGHAAGEVASSKAIEAIVQFAERHSADSGITWPFGFDQRLTPSANALVSGIRMANQSLFTAQQDRSELSGMGTTIATLQVDGDQATLAHVGDSRVYRLRGDEMELLTSDHSWVNEQLQKNIITAEEARNHRYKNVITRALGNRIDLEIDIRIEDVLEGDRFLLCSDGLSGMVEDDQLRDVFVGAGDDLRAAANKMVAMADEAGGHDNISVVLVRCGADSAAD